MTNSSLRRSTRARVHTPNVYEEAKKRIEEEEEEEVRVAVAGKSSVKKKQQSKNTNKHDADEDHEMEDASKDDTDNDNDLESQDDENSLSEEEQQEQEETDDDDDDDSNDDDDDDDDDEDYHQSGQYTPKGKAISNKHKNKKTKSTIQIQVQHNIRTISPTSTSTNQRNNNKRNASKSNSKSKTKTFANANGKNNGTKNTRMVQNALLQLSKKVLIPADNHRGSHVRGNKSASSSSSSSAAAVAAEKKKQQDQLANSLFSQLITSHTKSKKNNTNSRTTTTTTTSSTSSSVRYYHDNHDKYYTQPTSPYTQNLTQIAHDLIKDYNQSHNPNNIHLHLLNLIFLSIGGSCTSMLYPKSDENDDDDDDDESENDLMEEELNDRTSMFGQSIDVQDWDSNDWNHIYTNLVDDMRHSPLENIPLCCDPYGALHWNAMQAHIHMTPSGANGTGTTINGGVKNASSKRGGRAGEMDGGESYSYAGSVVGMEQQVAQGVNVVSERDLVIKKKNNGNLALAVNEYRSIFEEFWYILGTVALMEGGMSSTSSSKEELDDEEDSDSEEEDSDDDDDDDDDNDSEANSFSQNRSKRKKSPRTSSSSSSRPKKKKAKKTKTSNTTSKSKSKSTTRFDSEVVNEILSRLTELVIVNQPDLRAAATIATLFLTQAIVDKTAYIQDKLEITTRQYTAAMKSSKSSNTTLTSTSSASASSRRNSRTNSRNNATTSGGGGAKAKSLKLQLDSLKRTNADLEHLIETMFIQTIFIHRYRDSNMYIRASCIQALGRMTVIRPDLFLIDKYLKYFGWMMSDKAECVRIAALEGLLLPFEVVEKHQHQQQLQQLHKDDLMTMEKVVAKFLPRIVDCVNDIHPSVQERAMKMMLALVRNEFLDEAENEDEKDLMEEHMWDQVNLKALERNTTPEVRRDALYFIMEQLEDFDDSEDSEDENETSNKKKSKPVASNVIERKIAQRLEAITSWAAHTLTAGEVPIQKIQIHLVDYLVHSLRAMPEHKSIVTNWTAMIRAITEDNVAITSQGTSAGDRADVAKQRILVQMLMCAAKEEVLSFDPDFLNADLDPDVTRTKDEDVAMQRLAANKGGKKSSSKLQLETLSIVLIKALPRLVEKFKTDSTILESLTDLPRFFTPSVLSLPQRKSDFVSLTKNLTEVFLQSTDDKVLQNTAFSLSFLCKDDHARTMEAKTSVKKTLCELRDRILFHLSTSPDNETDNEQDELDTPIRKSPRRKGLPMSLEPLISDSEDCISTAHNSKELDKEYALCFNLKRIGTLGKRFYLSDYMDNGDDENEHVELLCNYISDGLSHRLRTYNAKKEESDDNETSDSVTEASIWESQDTRLPKMTARVVYEGLQFLLSVAVWRVKMIQEENRLIVEEDELMIVSQPNEQDKNSELEVGDDVIRLRDRLIALVELCFEQHLITNDDEEEEDLYSPAQREWSESIQEIGGLIASDLRSLFIKEWSNADSAFLRAAAIKEDSRLIGGYVRYFLSREMEMLRNNEHLENEDVTSARALLLPMGRSIASNWKLGNRREAGHVLAHITGSGSTASEVVDALSRLLKKVEPVRLLEAHMASLRLCYDAWLDFDPEDTIDDNLTQETSEETMDAFGAAEQKHKEQFKTLLNQAHRFSSSLGVRKLSDDSLSPALLGFMREGIRYAFVGDGELLPGCTLSFLSVLCKYAHWLKRNKTHLQNITEYLHEMEITLKAEAKQVLEEEEEHFDGINQDDLLALTAFRAALGLKESVVFLSDEDDETLPVQESASTIDTMTPDSRFELTPTINEDDDESRDIVNNLSVSSSANARRPRGSSTGSALSKISSTRSSLSPLYEEDEESPVTSTPGATLAKNIGQESSRTDDSGYLESPVANTPGATLAKNIGQESSRTDDSGYLESPN